MRSGEGSAAGRRAAIATVAVTIALLSLTNVALAHGVLAAQAPQPGSPLPPTGSLLAPPAIGGPDQIGSFGPLFTEPTIDGRTTGAKCIPSPHPNGPGYVDCKPAAGTLVVLPDKRILYWDALEGTENVKYSIVAEYGKAATNDSSRLLYLNNGNPYWRIPAQFDGGANPSGNPYQAPLIPGFESTQAYNSGALFGSDQVFLPNGDLIVQGGTDYSGDPQVPGTPFGEAELQGLRSTRVFDPKTNRFYQTGDTEIGRWYPTLTETGDGKIVVFGGVRKLIKPAYPDAPLSSGRNVVQTETYDPTTGKWSDNGTNAQRSLPLYPRLNELPDGHVLYNGAGQAFNPDGQGYDEALWNLAASYDPAGKSWKTLGVPYIGTAAPGFRGSTFSVELPLQPDANGQYTKASFLTAGGVLAPTPGSYFGIPQSDIATIDTTGGQDTLSSHSTGSLNNGRWFSSGVLLPTGQVLAVSGSDRDDVVSPGVEIPVKQLELFDPASETWKPVASQANGRTYHNSAALLPDGRVLIGGHAPISTLYTRDTTVPGGFANHDGRDPSFQIYSPPYLFYGSRPSITSAPSAVCYARGFNITTTTPADQIKSVLMIRYTAATHVVDGGQVAVNLPITARQGNTIQIAAPPAGNVAPPGPYMVFVNGQTPKGLAPSTAAQVSVQAGGPGGTCVASSSAPPAPKRHRQRHRRHHTRRAARRHHAAARFTG